MLSNGLKKILRRQEDYKNGVNLITNAEYIEQYVTLKLKLPRRSGHSTAIVDIINDENWQRILESPLVLTRTKREQSELRRNITNPNCKFGTLGFSGSLIGAKTNAVFVDNASHIPADDLTRVVDYVIQPNIQHNKYCVLVLLG